FYQTVPDANRFKINGRPLIMIWSSGPLLMTNTQGNLSRALTYVRQCCQRDFGFNPIIIDDWATTKHDTTCTNAGVLDGFRLGLLGEIFEDADREGERMYDKRLGTPAGKRYADGQAEVPASSGFTHATEAILQVVEVQQRILHR
ncbi:MAG: carbohydrate binding module family protein, partial [Pedosphaera sp.]|nr:carbohydrate binding module family protein [Pedosphaera sp.]